MGGGGPRGAVSAGVLARGSASESAAAVRGASEGDDGEERCECARGDDPA